MDKKTKKATYEFRLRKDDIALYLVSMRGKFLIGGNKEESLYEFCNRLKSTFKFVTEDDNLKITVELIKNKK